jgi:hypothetical protein
MHLPQREVSAAETWPREGFARVIHELQLFGRTFAAFVLQPGRSAHAWQTGEQTFMNPLGFAAAAAGVYWAVVSLLAAVWPIPGSDAADTVAEQLTSAVGPYVHYGLLGITMHIGLRLLGSRRSVLGSIGVAFFTGGSLGTLAALILTASTRWFGHARGTGSLELGPGDLVPFGLLLAAVIFYSLVCFLMVRGLMGLHRTAGWKGALAAAFAIIITALLFGTVLPEGSYGWRPYLDVDLVGGFSIAFGFQG